MWSLFDLVLASIGTTACIFVATICYIVYAQGEWKRKGVVTVKSPIPLLGNFGEAIMKRKALPYIIQDIYVDIMRRGKKFAGMYQFTRPNLYIIDPKLISEVLVKNFDHFTDRASTFGRSSGADDDDMFARSMLQLTGDEWRAMRHQLSPAFTASKLKGMLGLMEDTCRQLTRYLTTRVNPNEPLNVKETCRRFTADVISSAAFGTVSDSLNNKNSEFFDNGMKILDFSGTRTFVALGYSISPRLMRALNIPFIRKDISEFFKNSISSTIQYRERENKSRPDMVQLLLDARNQHNMKISDLDITAQAFTFFLGGFETVSSALSFCFQLLTMHPDVQSRLRTEVVEALEKGQGSLSYDALHELPYMEMVLAEILRMYFGLLLERECTKSLHLPEFDLKIEKGTVVGVPVFGLHNDPNYYPEPEKFDPERFSEENKRKIQPFTYLPFGNGPRNCIGLRYAQMEIKLCLAHVLSKVDLEPCSKTPPTIYFEPSTVELKPEGGFWINVRPREVAA